MLDKRRHARVSVSVDVDFSSDSNFFRGTTRDMSAGGIFVETDVGLPVSSQVNLYIHLLDKSYCIRCRVAWQKTGQDGAVQGVGLEFLDLHAAAKRTIEAFMALRKPIRLDPPSATF
jgi:uncharacterized protein (TIGR02266 family)